MVQAFGPIEKPGEVQGAMDPGSNSRFSPEAMDPGRLKTPPDVMSVGTPKYEKYDVDVS